MTGTPTTYEEIFGIFFSKVVKDESFFVKNMVSPEESFSIATKFAKDYLDESIYTLVLQDNLDCQVDFINDRDDIMEQFNFKLNLIEKELLTDIMLEKHLDRHIVARVNSLRQKYHSSDLRILSPANELKAFDSSMYNLRKKNKDNIHLYKKRDRKTFKFQKFDFGSLE